MSPIEIGRVFALQYGHVVSQTLKFLFWQESHLHSSFMLSKLSSVIPVIVKTFVQSLQTHERIVVNMPRLISAIWFGKYPEQFVHL